MINAMLDVCLSSSRAKEKTALPGKVVLLIES